LDNLGVTANLTFTSPTGGIENVIAHGTATAGQVSDSQVDYTLIWDTLTVPFIGGSFEISLNNISLNRTNDNGDCHADGAVCDEDEYATITLVDPNTQLIGGVPEPMSIALFGTGLVTVAATRRRKRARK
jgi:hypothetical protein